MSAPCRAAVLAACCALSGGCTLFSPEAAGERVFAASCASCHGPEGRGMAGAGPDLTRLAARAGGVFPQALVLARVEGYGLPPGARGGAMPLVGDGLAGRLVLVDRGDGQRVAVPRDLADVLAWLRSVQG